MVNFADAITKVSRGKLVTTTPTRHGVETVLRSATQVNEIKGMKLGGIPTVMQDMAMYEMGAVYPQKSAAHKWMTQNGPLDRFRESIRRTIAFQVPARIEERMSTIIQKLHETTPNIIKHN